MIPVSGNILYGIFRKWNLELSNCSWLAASDFWKWACGSWIAFQGGWIKRLKSQTIARFLHGTLKGVARWWRISPIGLGVGVEFLWQPRHLPHPNNRKMPMISSFIATLCPLNILVPPIFWCVYASGGRDHNGHYIKSQYLYLLDSCCVFRLQCLPVSWNLFVRCVCDGGCLKSSDTRLVFAWWINTLFSEAVDGSNQRRRLMQRTDLVDMATGDA